MAGAACVQGGGGGGGAGLSEEGAEGELVGGEGDVVGVAAAAPREDGEAARGAVCERPVPEVPEELGVGEPHAAREREQHLVAVLLEALPPAPPRSRRAARGARSPPPAARLRLRRSALRALRVVLLSPGRAAAYVWGGTHRPYALPWMRLRRMT